MSNKSFPPDENNNKPKKKGEDLLNAMARFQAEQKMAEVNDGIQTFLRLAYLRRKGVIKGNITSKELDIPTTIIDILSDWLVTYYLILKDIKTPIPEKKTGILKKIESGLEGVDSKSNHFIHLGDVWKVKYKEESIFLGDRERLHYLLHLLDNTDREIHSHDLIKTC